MLVFTDESGSFYFYDITDGSELFQYKQVDNNLFHKRLIAKKLIRILLLFLQPESIEFENAICKMIFLNKEVINYKSMEQDM